MNKQIALDALEDCVTAFERRGIWGPTVDRARSALAVLSMEDSGEVFLLHLIDVVWGVANEDQSVPATEWAQRMIQQARDSFDPVKTERRAALRVSSSDGGG